MATGKAFTENGLSSDKLSIWGQSGQSSSGLETAFSFALQEPIVTFDLLVNPEKLPGANRGVKPDRFQTAS